MQRLWWIAVFFSLGCSPAPIEIRLAPGVTNVDSLVFSIALGDYDVSCRAIAAASCAADGSHEMESCRTDWKVQASEPLPCPKTFKWGENLGEGWEVLTAPLPLERNRSYLLVLTTISENAYEHTANLELCIFSNGEVVAVPYHHQLNIWSESEKIVECTNEGKEAPVAPEAA